MSISDFTVSPSPSRKANSLAIRSTTPVMTSTIVSWLAVRITSRTMPIWGTTASLIETGASIVAASCGSTLRIKRSVPVIITSNTIGFWSLPTRKTGFYTSYRITTVMSGAVICGFTFYITFWSKKANRTKTDFAPGPCNEVVVKCY